MVEYERTGPLDKLIWGVSRVTMWLPAFIVLIILYEVVLRYVFGRPTLWVNETSLWVAGAVYMFAGLYSMQQRSHIRIFILYDLAPRSLRRFFDVVTTICICVFAIALIWGGFNEALEKLMTWERFGTKFNPPIPATIKPLILLTMALLALQSISNLIYDWNRDQGELKHVEGIAELLADVGEDHLSARPAGEADDHSNLTQPTDNKKPKKSGQGAN